MDSSAAITKILAGGAAGVSETLITYPAEFAKTRRQLSVTQGARAPRSSLAILRSTVGSQGLRGVYAGCGALAASNAAKAGIRFLAFDATRGRLDALAGTGSGQPRPAWVNVVSGLSAGVAESVLVVTPGEAIKTKMIHAASCGGSVGPCAGRGPVAAAGMLVRQEGVRGLWSGLVPVVCKQGTNSAVRFTTFAMLQERVARRWPGLEGGVGPTLILGAISGIFTVYASMPFDNIKTRMQQVDARYNGMVDCARQILQKDGVGAFWRGSSPRLVRLMLSSGITFTVYDQVVQLIKLASLTDSTAATMQRL